MKSLTAQVQGRNTRGVVVFLMTVGAMVATGPAFGQSDADELAKKLQNPVASLISVPFQLNYDAGIGPDDEGQFLLNIQPVVPFSLGDDWTFVQRSIVPVVDAPYGVGTGLSDITLQGFFSPAPKEGRPIWGIGPVVTLPTATKDELGSEKWNIGPAFVILKQTGAWTYGILAMNTWSVAGADDRDDVNAGLFQPFLARGLGGGWSISGSADAAVNWKADEKWTIPLIASVSKVVKLGSQPASIGGGVKYYVEKPDGGPDWGLRLNFSLLFPRS